MGADIFGSNQVNSYKQRAMLGSVTNPRYKAASANLKDALKIECGATCVHLSGSLLVAHFRESMFYGVK